MNGLNINLKEFERLPARKQMSLLFENTEQLKLMISTYKTELKIHRWGFVGILFIITGGKFVGFI